MREKKRKQARDKMNLEQIPERRREKKDEE